MERLQKLVWPWVTFGALEREASRRKRQELEKEEEERRRQLSKCNVVEATCRLCAVTCSILFWGVFVYEVHGFVAASSAALVIVLCYGTLEAQNEEEEEEMPNFETWGSKSELFEKLVKKVIITIRGVFRMQQEQPRIFCSFICIVLSSSLWLMGYESDIFSVACTLSLSILLMLMILLRFPLKELACKEWDNEMEEFLPSATEDDLHILKRAGETGERSPTPPHALMDSSFDAFNDEHELLDLSIPSHEDSSSADELELSELDISASETDVDGIRFQSGYFERSSSSDYEDDVPLKSKQFIDEDDDSCDSEFEIIDSRELNGLMSV